MWTLTITYNELSTHCVPHELGLSKPRAEHGMQQQARVARLDGDWMATFSLQFLASLVFGRSQDVPYATQG